jgi:hypothetical protein
MFRREGSWPAYQLHLGNHHTATPATDRWSRSYTGGLAPTAAADPGEGNTGAGCWYCGPPLAWRLTHVCLLATTCCCCCPCPRCPHPLLLLPRAAHCACVAELGTVVLYKVLPLRPSLHRRARPSNGCSLAASLVPVHQPPAGTGPCGMWTRSRLHVSLQLSLSTQLVVC